MKLKSLFLAMLVMLSCAVMAQVESGKVYRIVSSKYGTVITENPVSHTLSCAAKGSETDYQQMWEFTLDENSGKYVIMNLFSRRYIQNESGTNVKFRTGSSKVYFAVRENATYAGNYNIDASNRVGGWGMHCDGSSNIVPWSDGPDKDGISGTEWKFEEVSISDQQKEDAYNDYIVYNNVYENRTAIINKVNDMFADKAGTELKAEYQNMGYQELQEVMDEAGIPADLQEAIIKIKNDSWTVCEERPLLGEKNFRVYDYKPYSDTEKWKDILFLRPFNRINNPTGICSESDRAYIYVFVEDIPEGANVWLAEMNGTGYWGTDTKLVEGLNIVPSANKNGVLYVRYVVDTHTGFSIYNEEQTAKKLSDYPTVKVHIEGGYVNGFWSKERGHTNDDWKYMCSYMFKNPGSVQAKGDMSLLNFRTYEFTKECPSNIEGIINLWDFWNERQRYYMKLDKYAPWFNNMQLAMSDDNGFMDAGAYRTHYNNNTLNTIVNYNRLISDAGSSWGPNHEIGHTNQYAFQIVGTSEVSNNALTNFAIFDQGTHTSRGNNLENQILDFNNKVPYVVRGEKEYGQKLFSMTRMYFQLFLYFHAAGKNPEFYRDLFDELRKERLVGWTVTSWDELDENGFNKYSVNAVEDQLRFVEKCCEVANMDLTEFFEAWGFFIPMKNAYVGDYGHHYVYLLQEDIDACKARIKAKNYPKKGGQIMFLEDRVRATKRKESPFCDGTGYRANYADWNGERIGEVGKFGQWEDCIDESVKAEGYYYTIVKDKVVIKEASGAKGALGFKLYDENDNLLSYTNRLEMNIPVGTDRLRIKVVAAQANGENADVKPASEGPAEMQKAALSSSLESAKRYLDRKIIEGFETQIGRLYVDSLASLQKVYDDAIADTKNATVQGTVSFAEWAAMLDEECDRLSKNRGAMINLEEGMKVTFMSPTNRKGVLVSTGGGVVSKLGVKANADVAWNIEYAGIPNVYYLRDVNGNYVRDFALGEMIDANVKGTSNAEKFTFGYDEQGYVYFETYERQESFGQQTTDGSSSEEKLVKTSATDARARWRTKYVEDNSAEFYKKELDAALATARMLFTEIVNIDSIGKMNIFNENVIVLDRNLEETAVNLYNCYEAVVKDVANAKLHKEYLNELRKCIYAVQGKYIVKAPIATKDDVVMWYRLCNKETGDYLSVNSSKNTLKSVPYYDVDDNALWSFAATGVKNCYEMYNCATGGFVCNVSSRNLNADGKDGAAITVSYDAEQQAVVLNIDYDGKSYPFYDSGTKVAIPRDSKDSSYWELELVEMETNRDIADKITIIEDILEEGNYNEDFYDLSGRKVANPTRGIYIQNGKKVFYK